MSEQVTVVIPAYNESERIAAVLKPLIGVRKKGIISDIIVVDDGSIDSTAKTASNFDIKLVKLSKNQGKGAAMAAGIEAAKTEIVLFLDADLVGLREVHVRDLLAPIVDNEKIGMTIGVFCKSGWIADIGNMLQLLSGQRAVRKDWVSEIAGMADSRYGVDSLMTIYARKHKIKIIKIYMLHIHHVYKEQKGNPLIGFFRFRMKMYLEIARTLAKGVK